MWSHSIVGTESSGDSLRILIDYTDGTLVVHDSLYTNSSSADLNWVKASIVRKIDELDSLATFAASIPTGTIDLTLPDPPAATEPPVPVIEMTTFSESSFRFDGHGVFGTCTGGGTLTLDFEIDPVDHPQGQKINGGMIVVGGGKVGDWIECSVVDAGNILPAPYTGATLEQWVTKWYTPENGFLTLETPYAGLIPDGFYLRIIYHSTGTTDVSVAMNYMLHSRI